jgi:PAS domain S-box-containing protein
VLDTVPGLVFVFDEGDGIVWGNRRLQEKTGYTPATLRGMEPAQLFGDADAKAVRHALQAVRRGSTPVTVRVTLLTNGGRTIPCEFTGRCLPEGAGQAGGVVGTGRELSVLEERERELRRERDRLSALYAGLPSPVVHYRVKNGAALVQGVNTAFEEVFGFSEADILGEDLDGFIAPEDQVRQAETLTREAVEEGIVQAEVVRETEGGRHYFRLDSVLFSGGDRPEGYAIYTDVTEQKEREQTLRD